MGVRPAVALGCLLVCFPSPAMGASDDRLAIPVHLAVVVSDDCPGREVFVDRLKARSARIREARADTFVFQFVRPMSSWTPTGNAFATRTQLDSP